MCIRDSVLAVAAVVLGAVLLVRDGAGGGGETEARRVAEEFSVVLSSYDYRRLDDDLEKVKALGVGHFLYQYEAVLGGEAFRKALVDNQAVATAKVVKGPFVAAFDGDQARVYTVLEQRVEGRTPPEPTTRQVLVETMLVNTRDGWKVDWVELS